MVDIISNCVVLLTQRRNSYPPACLGLGNVSSTILLNSSLLQEMSEMHNHFSPNPASSNVSFIAALQGTLSSVV